MIAFNQLCTTLNNLLLDTRPEIRDSCLECISNIIVVTKYSSGKLLNKVAYIIILNILFLCVKNIILLILWCDAIKRYTDVFSLPVYYLT